MKDTYLSDFDGHNCCGIINEVLVFISFLFFSGLIQLDLRVNHTVIKDHFFWVSLTKRLCLILEIS